jgi:virginiamycin B lyase
MWFTDVSRNRLGRISTTGKIVDLCVSLGKSQLSGIAAGPDGNIWFAETRANKIARFDLTEAVQAAPGK